MPSRRSLRTLGFGAAAAIPLTLGVAAQANATPYAYASNTDTLFQIAAVAGTGTYTPNTATAKFSSGNSVSINGSGISSNDSSVAGADAKQVTQGAGPFPIENTMARSLLGGTGARADSYDTGFAQNGGNVAEGNLTTYGPGSSAVANGQISSTNTSAITVTVGNGVQLTVSFRDTFGLSAITAAAGESANAAITSTVVITDAAGATVFSFAPSGGGTGSTSAVKNGTVNSDPFSLNQNVTSASGASSTTIDQTGTYSATSNPLPTGTYTVSINQEARMDLSVGTPTATPEPASLALLGAGLIGMGVLRRKSKAS